MAKKKEIPETRFNKIIKIIKENAEKDKSRIDELIKEKEKRNG